MLTCWVTAPLAVCTSEIAWLTFEIACVVPPICVVNPCAAIYPAGLSCGPLIDWPEESCCSRVAGRVRGVLQRRQRVERVDVRVDDACQHLRSSWRRRRASRPAGVGWINGCAGSSAPGARDTRSRQPRRTPSDFVAASRAAAPRHAAQEPVRAAMPSAIRRDGLPASTPRPPPGAGVRRPRGRRSRSAAISRIALIQAPGRWATRVTGRSHW